MTQAYETGLVTRKINFEDPATVVQLFGDGDNNLRLIEEQTGVALLSRGTELTMAGQGPDVAFTERVLRQLYRLAKKGMPLYGADVERALAILNSDENANLQDVFLDKVFVSVRNKVITPRGLAQKLYVEQIRHKDMVFGIGPAGTGKTYLAMAMAVAALLKKEVRRIVLTRPAVEAGEKLGFLPGDLAEKVNPYLRPLYDALNDLLDCERAASLLEQGMIEVAPLAFMRGRTLNNAFIILDEAQNTTCEQMKMFLTRLGFGSKAVITGDITQIDLPHNTYSGLVMAKEVLNSVPGIGIATFTEADVVRHPLVQRVVKAFEQHEHNVRALQVANGNANANGAYTGAGTATITPPVRVEARAGGFREDRIDRTDIKARQSEKPSSTCGSSVASEDSEVDNVVMDESGLIPIQISKASQAAGSASDTLPDLEYPVRRPPDNPESGNSSAATD